MSRWLPLLACLLACRASAAEDVELRPGTYRLWILANQGRAAAGKLFLKPGSANDVSPRTGKRAEDGRVPPVLIGWSDVPFRDIGAPLGGPEPGSQDPVYPGVVVTTSQSLDPPRPPNAPVVLVGTVSNTRDGTTSQMTDGSGIGLFVQRAAGGCLHGVWRVWGLARVSADMPKGPTGRFSLCPQK